MPAGDALGGHLLQHLGQRGAQLLEGDVLEQRHRPAVEDHDDQRDRRDLHGLRDLRGGVDVDEADQEAALELAGQVREVVDDPWRSRASATASRTPAAPGAVIDASMVAWMFSSVTCTAYADPGRAEAPLRRRDRRGAARRGRAGRFRADRSIAPGRENGCCVMAILGSCPMRPACG